MKSKLVLLEWYTTSYFYKNMAFIFHIWLTVKDSVLHDSSSPLPDGHVLVSSQMCYTCEVGQKCLWCAQSSDPCRRLPPVYPPRIHLSCISQLPFTPDTHTLCCRWQSRLEESSKIELIRGTVLKTNDLPRAEWAGLLTMAQWLPPARNLTNRGVRTQILNWSNNRSDFITIRVIPSI